MVVLLLNGSTRGQKMAVRSTQGQNRGEGVPPSFLYSTDRVCIYFTSVWISMAEQKEPLTTKLKLLKLFPIHQTLQL